MAALAQEWSPSSQLRSAKKKAKAAEERRQAEALRQAEAEAEARRQAAEAEALRQAAEAAKKKAEALRQAQAKTEKYWSDIAEKEVKKFSPAGSGRKEAINVLVGQGFDFARKDEHNKDVYERREKNRRTGIWMTQKISVASTPHPQRLFDGVMKRIRDSIRHLYLDTPEDNIIRGNPYSRWDKDTEQGQGAR